MPSEPGPLDALLAGSHLIVPDALPGLVDFHAGKLGARSARVFLTDLDQRWLVPLPGGPDPVPARAAIGGTLAGRCFRSVQALETGGEHGGLVMWVPVVDGTERLGVLQYEFDSGWSGNREELLAFTSLVAELIMSKDAYGDFFQMARRQEPITVAAELLWQLLPPLTFGTEDLVISAAFVPTADIGGDAFDYGVDAEHALLAIFDAMGHGLQAGLMATASVAAFRNGRRRSYGLLEIAEHIGGTVKAQFGSSRFVTGILASLELATGRLCWCDSGHPPPLLLRNGKVVKHLDLDSGVLFGVGPASALYEEQLEAGDRVLLYTDGVTDARDGDGEFFGVERLVDLVSRTPTDVPPPETMRRLMHAIEEYGEGPIRDDATVMMVEWRGAGTHQLQI